MKPIENDILTLLKKDSRISHQEIASLLGKDDSEITKIIEDLEKRGAILKYTTLVNEDLLDESPNSVKAMVELRISPEKNTGFESIAKRICNYPQVVAHYLVSGDYDFLIIVEGRNHQEIASFIYEKLATMDNVTSTNTHFMLKKYKEHGTLIHRDDTPERMAVVA